MSARDHDAAQLQAELTQHQATATAPAPRFDFDVTVRFEDGTYRNKVRARNKGVAYAMALTDALKEWQPTTPTGADWFLLAIFDTEDDGPVAYFVRPAQAAT